MTKLEPLDADAARDDLEKSLESRTGGMELQRVAALADFYSEVARNRAYLTNCLDREKEFEHIEGMAERLRKLLEEGRVEKAMRWLGFMQGAMWAFGAFSLDELKDHSRSDFPIPTIEKK